MSPSSPRQRRHLQTKQAILDAARQILSQQGAQALSMRAIAEQIDYSPAGLYEYFGSKEDLLKAICVEGEQRLLQALRSALPQASPAEQLFAVGKAYIAFAMQNPQHYLLMFNTAGLGGLPDPQDAAESSFGVLLSVVAAGIASGQFQARPGYGAWEIAYSAWALVHGIAMLRLTYLAGMPADFEAADSEALRTFGQGLSR